MFSDRTEAGRQLADKVSKESFENPIVLAIPRGGVVVAKEVAQKLKASLDLIITRKIGYPGNPEFAVGAVDESGEVLRHERIDFTDEEYVKTEANVQKKEIERRYRTYLGSKGRPDLKDRDVIVVDDGVATGLTTLSAVNYLKKTGAKRVILAVPVIPKDNLEKIEGAVDKLIYLEAPLMFFAVGQFYANFPQTTDEEVIQLLKP